MIENIPPLIMLGILAAMVFPIVELGNVGSYEFMLNVFLYPFFAFMVKPFHLFGITSYITESFLYYYESTTGSEYPTEVFFIIDGVWILFAIWLVSLVHSYYRIAQAQKPSVKQT